jgi:hypothetical protein
MLYAKLAFQPSNIFLPFLSLILLVFFMDRVVDIPMKITKFLVCLKEEVLHKTILGDHQTNEENNI